MAASRLLYHYCSTPVGLAILQTRTFRLSALSAANDSLEGRVLGRVFTRMLDETDLPTEVVDVVSVIVEGYADSTEGFALCLSERGDLLSQWRAYAQDGSGVALGFSSDWLLKDFGEVNFGSQFFELTKVEYGEAGLLQTLKPLVDKLIEGFAEHGGFVQLRENMTREQALKVMASSGVESKQVFTSKHEGGRDLMERLLDTLAPLHFKIYDTNPASFQEECEWRLLRYRHRVALSDIEYFADNRSIKPYISCLIADPAREAIREVVLGPKHISKIDWVRAFLASVGLSHVVVKSSTIESYR